MNTVTIRQVRQNWPEVERRLAVERALIVTRHAAPLASLHALTPPKKSRRKRFSDEMRPLDEKNLGHQAAAHRLRQVAGGTTQGLIAAF